jgi:lycopene cyclase-like protein
LAREYAVLDNASVQEAFAHPGIEVRAGRLSDVLDLAPVVIDATGALGSGADSRSGGARGSSARSASGRVLGSSSPVGSGSLSHPAGTSRSEATPRSSGSSRSDGAPGSGSASGHREAAESGAASGLGGAEQTAFGVKVAAEMARPVVGPGEAVFMDWRQPLPGPATFLYAVPLPDGRVLLEETSLARRPGLPFAQLRERLLARLATFDIDPGNAEVERVRIPLESSRARCPAPTRSRGRPALPVYRRGVTDWGVARGLWTTSGCEWRVLPFGAAAGMVHPATGYGVGEALRLAPKVADAIVRGGAPEAHRVVWSARARVVHRLRRAGLGTLLQLVPGEHAAFFELFFGLPAHRQRAFLSGREDVLGNAAAMAAMFRAAPWSLRKKMAITVRG